MKRKQPLGTTSQVPSLISLVHPTHGVSKYKIAWTVVIRQLLRPQLPTPYIQDVLRLCGRSDPDIPEEEKGGHLYKGISENLFKVVARKTPITVKNFVAHVTQYTDFLDPRILKIPVQRLSGIKPASPIEETTAKSIKEVVRE